MKKRLLSFVLAVLMIASLLPATALAADIVDSGTCGAEGNGSNLTWTLDSEGVLTISGSGDMYDYDEYDSSSAPWYGSRSRVKSAVIADGVTSIGDYAFRDCYDLASVSIPDSVTSIGTCAFEYCSSLTSVTIPDNVTSIGDGPFSDCNSLTGIWVSKGNNDYSSDASGVLFDKNMTTLIQCPGSFSGAYTIPNSVTSIGDFAFSSCESLTSVTIPDSVTSIGEWAFNYCTSLTSVTIPDSVTSIGDDAFSFCASLTSVTIPDSVTSIGEHAFSYCTSLTSVTIPDSVTSIGVRAFDHCTSLKSVTIPDSVTSIGELAFSGCESLTSVTIPDSVTSIGEQAFMGCSSLTSVTIPDSVTSIHWGAFYDCSSLTSVTIPDSVTSIGDGAFASCTSLTGIWVAEGNSHYTNDASGVLFNKDKTTLVQCPGAISGSYAIPDSVTSIGEWAFDGCTSLTSVTIPDSVTSIGSGAFSICNKLTDVYYTGTEIAWNKIKISNYNDALKNATIHYFSEWTREKEPTCTEPGSETSVCPEAGCGKTFTREIPALGHSWDEGKVTKPATEAEDGVKTFTCTRCGETKTETIHSYKAVVTAPTCTEKGYTTHTCACGDSYVDTYVDALGHAWDNGKVTKEPTETETGVKTFTCTRCGETKTEVIPATGVVASGTCGAEGDGSNLTWTLDSEGVLTISGSGDMHGYDRFGAPWCGRRVKSAVIADGVTSIGKFAFAGCEYLTSVTIPDSVTSIGGDAFWGCTSLTSVTIPDSVTSIGEGAFEDCTSLTGIWVAEGNSHYSSDASGVLFNKDKTTLVQCPGAFREYTIPDSVTSIGRDAFFGCTSLTSVTIPGSVTSIGFSAFAYCESLTSVTIPDSVTSIGACAFEGCGSLTSVTIPDSVTSIGHLAFFDCTSLTDVYYAGSEAQWKAISISSNGNDDLLTANIHYNYGSHTHSYKDVVTAPTCTEKGYTTHTCACGNSYVDTYVDALGHAWDGGKVTKAATETETGIKTYTCTLCGETKTETIPKLTHEHSYKAVVTAPTCTEKGYTTHTCACGDSYVDTYVDALGHAWDNGKVTKEPTETETGVKTFTCTRCGETRTETIPKLTHEHNYNAVVTAPTCTEKGYTTHTCACGDSYVDTYVDALGHAWDNGKVTKEPTETETGVKTFTCTRCGETKTEAIPKLTHEHSYKAVVTAPTCTAKGYTTHTCACGDSYVDTYVDALGHAWDNGKVTKPATETEDGVKTFTCTRCGETKTEVIPATGVVDVTEMFTDVSHSWADDGIQYCVTHQLMSGIGNDLFGPKLTTTRAQIVQILYNLEGEPKVSGTTPFTDLTNDWYQDAVLWAYQTGVVAGTSSTTFEPDLPVTREQIAVILMEYMTRVLKLERTWTPADLSTFPDADSVSDWAKDALADAVALGLISGASNGGQTYLEPQGSATREQVATILMEFCKNVKK